MATSDNRLDLDANLVGYWGFDESLETDPALDGSLAGGADLTVTNGISVQAGRVGASRELNGTSSYAAVTLARLRLLNATTFMGWVKLDSYNSSGSNLRTVMSCGSGGGNLLYSVSVDSAGRLVYKQDSASGIVVVRTAINVIKTGQLYCVAVQRSAPGPNQSIQFVVDNLAIPVADVTVNGSGSALPIPPPLSNGAAEFSVGRSLKESDSAFWDGIVDEISLHDTARSLQPYLHSAYYRAALRNATARLSSTNNVLAVSSADLGAGVRWWCYEKDKDLYVVKESPFGFFGIETRLTTPGGGASTKAENPELIYDPTSDTLLVLFVAGNRIYKLTAQSTDVPATINMPFTADTGSIIKVLDNADGGAFALGGGQRPVVPEDVIYVNRQVLKLNFEDTPFDGGLGGGQQLVIPISNPTAPSAAFMNIPGSGMGVAVGPHDGTQGGYRIFRSQGGVNELLGTAVYSTTGNFFYLAISPQYGDIFYAEALRRDGHPSGVFSNAISFRNFEPILYGGWIIGREGDGTDTLNAGLGGAQQDNFDQIVYVNRTPIKISFEDDPAKDLGLGGGQSGNISCTGSNRPGNVALSVNL